jgi:hypothetical protein
LAGNKYLYQNAGVITELASNQTSAGVVDAGKIVALNASGILDDTIINSKSTSAGAGDAGKIPKLDSTGKLDSSMMPVGMSSESDTITASEALLAGDFVNLWNNSGIKARKADASTSGKEAHGFVLVGVGSGESATVYRISQLNNQLTTMTPGAKQYLSPTTPGARTETCPVGSGQTVQILGTARSATELIFAPQAPIVLA